MICDICTEREAVLFVQQLSLSGKKEIHLCTQCAKERGIDTTVGKTGASLKDLINFISDPKKLCYVCGKSLDDIQKKGYLGCPECYMAFHEEIKTMLSEKGLDLPYTGSMPKRLVHFRSILTDRIAIQNKLTASIAHEDYEKAAMYRDFLKTLEHPAVAGGEDSVGDLFDE